MTLFELGHEYLKRSEELMARIHKLAPEVKKLKGNELIVMKRRILSLYNDAAECKRCAIKLIGYGDMNIRRREDEQNRI